LLGDVTRITWATAALAVMVPLSSGMLPIPRGAERSLEIGLFAEDACMRLGMFGTVVGCLIMFGADRIPRCGRCFKTAALIQRISSSFGTAMISRAALHFALVESG
jgi:hypothetical protein